MAVPIPFDAPVTTATLPVSLLMYSLLKVLTTGKPHSVTCWSRAFNEVPGVGFGVCDLGDASGSKKVLAGEPSRVVRSKEYSDRGDVADFTGAGEQGMLIEGLLEVRTDHTGVCVPSVSTMPGFSPLTRIFLSPSFTSEHTSDCVTSALGAGRPEVHRRWRFVTVDA